MTDTTLDRCSLCPRLCRPACPVATHTAREAAVPAVIAEVLRARADGRETEAVALQAATLCVDCGACQEHCHLHTPLPEALRQARAELLGVRAPSELPAVQGEARRVVVHTGGPDWSDALAAVMGHDVAVWDVGAERLGARHRGAPGWSAHLRRVARALEGREPVVADGGVARVLEEAGVPFAWLHERLGGGEFAVSCACGPDPLGRRARCCGAGAVLAEHHPEAAARMARRWWAAREADVVADVRCARHLRHAGLEVEDAVDVLHARVSRG